MKQFTRIAGVYALFLLTNACASTEALNRRIGPEYASETTSWIDKIKNSGGTGMWMVTRGYHVGDDLVSIATNSPLSHAAILDVEKQVVIEAIADGVIETPLKKFLTEAHRVLLIQPAGWTIAKGKAALAKARSQLGKGYDFLGTIGIPDKERWYCSELAIWAMGTKVNKLGAHKVIHPKNMPKMGAVLFDSKGRDGQVDGIAP
jgi:uncharacterized protein YycO